jgi:hypothetical protein
MRRVEECSPRGISVVNQPLETDVFRGLFVATGEKPIVLRWPQRQIRMGMTT